MEMKNQVQNNGKENPLKGFKKWLSSSSEITAFIVLVIVVVGTSLVDSSFLAVANIRAIARMMSFTLIAAVGVTLTILIGEIDISVGSIAGFGAILCTTLAAEHNVPLVVAALISIVCCALLSGITGTLIVKYSMPPFVACIAIMYVGRSLAMVITNGYTVYPLPDIMNKIGLMEPLGTSVAFVFAIILVFAGNFILKKTVLGRKLYAIGDNKEVAKLAGIQVTKVKIYTFMVCGILSCIAGIFQAMQMQTGQPTIGDGWELSCIAACAIGGVSLLGGAGSLIGTFLGMCVMMSLNNALIIVGVNSHWQNIVIGAIMVGAVLLDIVRRNRKTK